MREPAPRWRELLRYRRKLVESRTAERNRLRDQLTEYRALKTQAEAYRKLAEKQYEIGRAHV
mgnify:CR=1 FL=1